MFAEGYVLADRYRLLGRIGAGGMGSVWRAEHVALGTPAAIKFMDPSLANAPGAIQRFTREAQSAASLRSSHVVQILDFGVDQNTPYLAMELLHGEDLRHRLAQRGRLAPLETAHYLFQAGKAVALAHQAGIVHRDLKPDNLFIAQEGAEEIVKVLDFGIAKLSVARDMSSDALTRTGAVLGTPHYMSPEQTHGRTTVDHRTDIWAFSVIAFECLTGCVPFDGATIGALALAICMEPLPLPSSVADVPPGFDEWFTKGVAREPGQRFRSVREQMTQLASLCGLEGASYSTDSQNTELMQPVAPLPVPQRDSAASVATQSHQYRETGAPALITVAPPPKRSRLPLLLGLAALALVLGSGTALWSIRQFAGAQAAGQSADTPASAMPSALPGAPPSATSHINPSPTVPVEARRTAPRETSPQPAQPTLPRHTATKPSHTATKPRHTATNPPHTATKPSHTATKPSHTATKPSHTATKPSHSATNPPHTATKPSHKAPKPASARDRVAF